MIDRHTNLKRRAGTRGAFTLIEMLVVISVILLLISIIVPVAKYLRNEALKKETEAIAKIMMNAVQNYYDVCKSYPPGDGSSTSGMQLLKFLQGQAYPSGADAAEVRRVVIPRLSDLPSDALSPSDKAIKDAWGNFFTYELKGYYTSDAYRAKYGALSGQPLLTSAGPDGNINTPEDNIAFSRN